MQDQYRISDPFLVCLFEYLSTYFFSLTNQSTNSSLSLDRSEPNSIQNHAIPHPFFSPPPPRYNFNDIFVCSRCCYTYTCERGFENYSICKFYPPSSTQYRRDESTRKRRKEKTTTNCLFFFFFVSSAVTKPMECVKDGIKMESW